MVDITSSLINHMGREGITLSQITHMSNTTGQTSLFRFNPLAKIIVASALYVPCISADETVAFSSSATAACRIMCWNLSENSELTSAEEGSHKKSRNK